VHDAGNRIYTAPSCSQLVQTGHQTAAVLWYVLKAQTLLSHETDEEHCVLKQTESHLFLDKTKKPTLCTFHTPLCSLTLDDCIIEIELPTYKSLTSLFFGYRSLYNLEESAALALALLGVMANGLEQP
jgi:hypothetical protein